jgi:23S rRNA-/tRNA-specific pseudouridylate synthase
VTDSRAELSVLFESADVVIVDKPAGIATEPDAKGQPSLRDAVAARLGGSARAPHAVSRLDRAVSGVVTFAISSEGTRALSHEGAAGRFRKLYVALLDGRLEGVVERTDPIEGRDARSRFRSVAHAEHARGTITLALLEPLTGRFHQLRAHADALGAPVIGERRHGHAPRLATRTGRVVAPGRLLLHALAVAIPWPGRAQPITARAAIPAAFAEAWSALDGAPEAWEAVDQACDDWLGQRSSA